MIMIIIIIMLGWSTLKTLTLRTMKRRTLKREPKQVKNSLKMATIKKRGRRRIKRGKRRITTWETTRIKVSASFFGPSQSPLLPPSPKYVKFTIYKVPWKIYLKNVNLIDTLWGMHFCDQSFKKNASKKTPYLLRENVNDCAEVKTLKIPKEVTTIPWKESNCCLV